MTDIKDINSKNQTDQNTSINRRRKFLKNAMMAAPIITAVASKPVWGIEMISLSGNLSGNLSQKSSQYGNGPVGRSPGYWAQWEKITSCKESHQVQGKDRLYHWHQSGYKPTDSFSAIFGTNPLGVANNLGSVMRVAGNSDSFDRHAIAALLSSTNPSMRGQVPYTAERVIKAYQIVARNPTSQQSFDIIETFDSLFDNHDETEMLSGNIYISDTYLAQLSMIAGVSSPDISGVCGKKGKR